MTYIYIYEQLITCYIYVYIYIYKSISNIIYGTIPVRDSPHPTPPHAPPAPAPADGFGMGWGVVGGIRYGYISLLDIGYWMYIFIYI